MPVFSAESCTAGEQILGYKYFPRLMVSLIEDSAAYSWTQSYSVLNSFS
jgi:hypothetical protein